MQVHLISTQQNDGGFIHSVTFGDASPMDAAEDNCINCASLDDAARLRKKIEDMQAMLSMNVECSVYENDVLPTIERAFVSAPETLVAA